MKLKISKIDLPFLRPIVISDYTFSSWGSVRVELEHEGLVGRGEGLGVYYLDETAEKMEAQIESVRDSIEQSISRETLRTRLASGGARNAVDSALWDLEAKTKGVSIWQLLDINPSSLNSVATIGIGTADEMRAMAAKLATYPKLKIKLDNQTPIERIEAIKAERPDADLIIDVNQGWSFEELCEYALPLKRLGVSMIEQPLPRGADEELEGYQTPVPLGADESCLNLSELDEAMKRYDVINIKLDKCGGLTEALEIVHRCRDAGKSLMVGNMSGTSLSMAPAYVIGQYCQYVDLDGPLILKDDVPNALTYNDGGIISIPTAELWG